MRSIVSLAGIVVVMLAITAGTARAGEMQARSSQPSVVAINTGVTLNCILTATRVVVADFLIGKLIKGLGGVTTFLKDVVWERAFRIDRGLYNALLPLKDFADLQRACNVRFYFA